MVDEWRSTTQFQRKGTFIRQSNKFRIGQLSNDLWIFYDVYEVCRQLTVNHWNRSRINGIWNTFLIQFLFCVSFSFSLTTVILEQTIKISNFIPNSCFWSFIKKLCFLKCFSNKFCQITSNKVIYRNGLTLKWKKLTWRSKK